MAYPQGQNPILNLLKRRPPTKSNKRKQPNTPKPQKNRKTKSHLETRKKQTHKEPTKTRKSWEKIKEKEKTNKNIQTKKKKPKPRKTPQKHRGLLALSSHCLPHVLLLLSECHGRFCGRDQRGQRLTLWLGNVYCYFFVFFIITFCFVLLLKTCLV